MNIFPKQIYLGAATRTPIGKFGGSLKRFSAPQLATMTLKEALSRAPEAANPSWVFLGHARQAGAGPNPAKQAAIFSGLSENIPAITFNQACASGLTAVFAGVEKIALGQAKSVWAGGVESMSNTPYLLPESRFGHKMGNMKILDGMVKDGFHCPMADMLMGETVERFIAQEMKVSRGEQDEFALQSQQKAERGWKEGKFKAETFAIAAEGKFPGLSEDEHRRGDTTLEDLARLKPVFDTKSGSVTAGNSSGITDGAAFIHLSNQKSSHAMAEFVDYETVSIDPKLMGIAPITAVQNLLQRQGLKPQDLEAFEINEAFAAQVIACQRQLKIPAEKINRNGGSIAIGHPIGATGARILTTLLHLLNGKPGALGVATLCVSGGQGVAVLVRAL